MKKDIQSLKELQAIDLEAKKLDDQIAAGQAVLTQRREEIERLSLNIEALQEKSASVEQRRRELEAETEDELVKLKDRQSKLMNVQTNREYQILLKEIEDCKRNNRDREEELVQLMERSETLKQELEEQRNVLTAKEQLLAEEQENVRKTQEDLTAQKEEIFKSRDEKAQKVSAGGLKKYEMLRAKRDGLAVVQVTRGVCHGCHMNIPPQLFNTLLRNEELLTCPTCHRMMYYEPEVD